MNGYYDLLFPEVKKIKLRKSLTTGSNGILRVRSWLTHRNAGLQFYNANKYEVSCLYVCTPQTKKSPERKKKNLNN